MKEREEMRKEGEHKVKREERLKIEVKKLVKGQGRRSRHVLMMKAAVMGLYHSIA